jgi:hypothetical protein
VGGLDSADEVTGFDDVDAEPAFNRRPNSGSGGGEGRRKGKKSPVPRDKYRPRSRRGMGRGFSFDLRGFEDTAKAMLAVTIVALALCAVILYVTFGMHVLPDLYGALAASIVVMALLFYTAAKLIRSG